MSVIIADFTIPRNQQPSWTLNSADKRQYNSSQSRGLLKVMFSSSLTWTLEDNGFPISTH